MDLKPVDGTGIECVNFYSTTRLRLRDNNVKPIQEKRDGEKDTRN